MNEATKKVTPIEMMTLNLKGRIDASRFHDGTYYTKISTPAKDAYSQPSSFVLRSQSQLGQVGEEIQAKCELSGFVRLKRWTDKNTGEQKTFDEENLYLTVI